ncbi:MAG: nucleotide-binding protein [Candidatus Dormibacteria bacterium]
MRIVVTGKGGVGKTLVSGTLARLLGRRGESVLALDCDPNPNLGIPLGLDHLAISSVRPVFNVLVERGHTHNDPRPDPEELLRLCQVTAADGVTLLATGEVVAPGDGACHCCGSHASTRALFGELSDDGRIVLADLEAGLNDLVWAKPGAGTVLLCVADTSQVAIDIAAGAVRIGRALGVTDIQGIANRCTEPGDQERLAAALGVEVHAIPEDAAADRADRLGVALLDLEPTSAVVTALDRLAVRLVGEAAAVAAAAGTERS